MSDQNKPPEDAPLSPLPDEAQDHVDFARSKARTDSSRKAAAGALCRALQDAFDATGKRVRVAGCKVGPSRRLRGVEAQFLMRVEGLGPRSVSAHIPLEDVRRDGGFLKAIELVYNTVARMIAKNELPTPRDIYRKDLEAMGFDPDRLGIPKRGQ